MDAAGKCSVRCVLCCSDRVNLAVLELIEGGRLQALKDKWWIKKGQCKGKDGPPKKVGIKQNVFLLYAAVHIYTLCSTKSTPLNIVQ